MAKKVVISCAVTGSIHTPSLSPNFPATPDQIIQQAVDAYKAGAAVLHIHARNQEGKPVGDFETFGYILSNIKKQCPEAVIRMPENRGYLPEGLSAPPLYTLEMLRRAVSDGAVLEGTVQRCDGDLNLYLQLGSTFAKIPREEVTAPWISGADREIAVLSRVGKQVCFTVESISADAKGAPTALLSRRKVQEQAMEEMRRSLKPGAVVVGKVVRMEPFGAFVDIGRGIVALLPTEYISAARIRHPNERFRVGQKILAVVKVFDRENRRITLTHKELLGTWLENASYLQPGETVRGIVRSVKEYGTFIELAPNLSGLADTRENLQPGDGVSVYIKSIRPDRMKIKLQIIEKLPGAPPPPPIRYQITDGVLDHWVYSPPSCEKPAVETVFRESSE